MGVLTNNRNQFSTAGSGESRDRIDYRGHPHPLGRPLPRNPAHRSIRPAAKPANRLKIRAVCDARKQHGKSRYLTRFDRSAQTRLHRHTHPKACRNPLSLAKRYGGPAKYLPPYLPPRPVDLPSNGTTRYWFLTAAAAKQVLIRDGNQRLSPRRNFIPR